MLRAIRKHGFTSMSRVLNTDVDMQDVTEHVANEFGAVFERAAQFTGPNAN